MKAIRIIFICWVSIILSGCFLEEVKSTKFEDGDLVKVKISGKIAMVYDNTIHNFNRNRVIRIRMENNRLIWVKEFEIERINKKGEEK